MPFRYLCSMKKMISYFRILYLRYLWRRYFNLFLRRQEPLEAMNSATEAVNAFIHCPGLVEDVLPFDLLPSQLSAPRERSYEEAQSG